MKDTLSESLKKIQTNRKRNFKILAVILCLSLVVTLEVLSALRQTGITMAGNASCGIEEHTHTEECFNKDNPCTKTEHVHTLSCYSDEKADVETQLDWQQLSKNNNKTGILKTDLVNFAKSQLGYLESEKNFQVDSNGNKHGYTRYGAWYGMPYSNWSAMFVSFCFNYSGSSTELTPYNIGAEAMKTEWESKNAYFDNIEKIEVGDILFIDNNSDGISDNVGIVTQQTDLYINTIEGDVENSVQERTYKKEDKRLVGFGDTPDVYFQASESSENVKDYLATNSLGLTENTEKNAFITNSLFSEMYNIDSPLGIAGSFHIVAFDSAYLNVHTNGNVLAKNVYASSNFGTNSKNGVDLKELSYIQNYLKVNAGSGADTTDYLILGSNNSLSLVDNGNALAISGTKIDRPKKSNIIVDANTATAPFIDLNYVENEVNSIVKQLASYKNSNSDILEVNTTSASPYLKIKNKDYTGIYTFTAEEIYQLSQNGNGLSMKGFETGGNGAIIVNVDCSDWDESKTLTLPIAYVYIDGQKINQDETIDFSAGKVLWNFINTARSSSTLLKIETNLMTGAVIAPDAHINLRFSYNGTAIGKVVENNSETHRTDYIGKIIPTGETGGAYIDVYKVDESNTESKLQGATFTLYIWNGSSWQIAEQGAQVTDANGAAYFKNLAYNTAYMLKETAAPQGFVLNEEPYYFYFEASDTTKNPIVMPEGFTETAEKDIFTKTVTNEAQHIIEYANVKIDKNWKNSEGVVITPAKAINVNFELWRVSRTDISSSWGNPEKIYDNIILNADINWTWQAGENELMSLNVVGTSSTYYAYYVVETTKIEGYTPIYNGISVDSPQTGEESWNIIVTNHQVETTGINILKEWYSKDGAAMTEPPVTEIEVQLYCSIDNGNTWSVYGSPLKVKADNNWQLSVDNLPVKDPVTGNIYSYQVKEFEIDNFSSQVETNSNGNIIIKNTCINEYTSVKVEKKWLRNDKYVNKTSGNVTIELYQISGSGSGQAEETVNVTVQVGRWYFGDVEFHNETYAVPIGTKMRIVYDFIPTEGAHALKAIVDGNTQVLTPVSSVVKGVQNNNTIYILTYEYEVTATTTLQGELRTYLSDYQHTVQVEYEEPEKVTTSLYKTVILNNNNNWTHTFGNLPKENCKYYVVEADSQEYSPVYKDSSGQEVNEQNPVTEGSIIIENTLTGNAYELPGTGGKGITSHITVGVIIVALALCCVYIKKFIKKGFLL